MQSLFTGLVLMTAGAACGFFLLVLFAGCNSYPNTATPIHLPMTQVPPVRPTAAADWRIQCVDCPTSLWKLCHVNLQLDTDDQVHVVYGTEGLRYARYDGAAWLVESVDDTLAAGMQNSFVLDSFGYPHIFYTANFSPTIEFRYARWTGDAWDIHILDNQPPFILETFDEGDWLGRSLSLALDPNTGYAHVSYFDLSNNNLKYAYWDGELWNTMVLDDSGQVGYFMSLAVDDAGHPHIAYHDQVAESLKYAHWTGNAWDMQTLDNAGSTGFFIELELDAVDQPHIVYWGDYNLKYAHRMGRDWKLQTFDYRELGHVYGYPSFVLDEQNTFSICYMHYFEYSSQEIRCARQIKGQWHITTIPREADREMDWFVSLDLDQAERLHVAYFDFVNRSTSEGGELKYARWSGAEWDVQTIVASGPMVGGSSSLAFDGADQPHIGYYDSTNKDLKYAHWTGKVWELETVDSRGNVGGAILLAVDGIDNPHLVYSHDSRKELKYARWDGQAWQMQVIDKGSSSNYLLALALDATNMPHVVYETSGSKGQVMYARYSEGVWQIEAVDYGGEAWLALDGSGAPHISYYDDRSNALKYAHLTKQGWEIQVVGVEKQNDPFHYVPTSLALDPDGYAHISYVMSDCLKYARWNGLDWQIQTVDAGRDVNGSSSLALDAMGHAHISYHQRVSDQLKYAHWTGSEWQIHTVDNGGDTSSLALDAFGQVHVSYDGVGADLKYASFAP